MTPLCLDGQQAAIDQLHQMSTARLCRDARLMGQLARGTN
ncbi:hypothetical protein C7S14_0209 [Burkholderia cepacia]|nr:hypothetical protein C7S14_0209 [Burkholderia cepacia]